MLRLALILLLLLPAAASARPSLPDIEDEVMCISCGTALNVSGAPSADETRDQIRKMIDAGLTKDEIKDRLVEEYGRNVLATPPASGRDLTAYLVPGLLALLAAGAVALTVRRWRRVGATAPDAGTDDLDDEDARRLERDMAGYDL